MAGNEPVCLFITCSQVSPFYSKQLRYTQSFGVMGKKKDYPNFVSQVVIMVLFVIA